MKSIEWNRPCVYKGMFSLSALHVVSVTDIESWCHHDMETLSALLALCEGNPLLSSGFPSQRASNAELWYFACCQPKQTFEWIHELPLIRDAMMLMTYCDVMIFFRKPQQLTSIWKLHWWYQMISEDCRISSVLDIDFHDLTHWPLEDLNMILKMEFSILFYWLVSLDLLMIMPSDECHRTLLMISQHWFT